MTFNENNSDVTDNLENENCNKKLSQNDTGSSQNKSHNKYKKTFDARMCQKYGKKIAGNPKACN